MPRKTLKERKVKPVEDTSNNRLAPVLDLVTGKEDPDDLMLLIIEAIPESEMPPKVGNFYTFVYSPKTPNIRYDEYPLVEVTQVFAWGFKGINLHYPAPRQYTWQEIVGTIHMAKSSEIKSLLSIPYMKLRLNS